MQRSWLPGLLLLISVGCASSGRVQNPFPGVFRVAVIPFNDKTLGAQGVDPLRVSKLFASELQKIPTYEVVPVQEVIEATGGQRIETNQAELAFAVARAVHAQAVIVGDIVEYNAYYPPRVGLHCEMYAMVLGEPEIVEYIPPPEKTASSSRGLAGITDWLRPHHWLPGCLHQQCPCPVAVPTPVNPLEEKPRPEIEQTSYTPPPDASATRLESDERLARFPDYRTRTRRPSRPTPVVEPWTVRHSRVFDGSNLGLMRKLQDYYFFHRDERGGDWIGYMERSEDFERYCCNQMIYEMLKSAGGEWTTMRGIRIPEPWHPWPWR